MYTSFSIFLQKLDLYISIFQFVLFYWRKRQLFSCLYFRIDKRIRHWMINRKHAIYMGLFQSYQLIWIFNIFLHKSNWETYFRTFCHINTSSVWRFYMNLNNTIMHLQVSNIIFIRISTCTGSCISGGMTSTPHIVGVNHICDSTP